MKNTDMLLELKAWARREADKASEGRESEWDQQIWACGTACCIAGKAALLDGWEFILSSVSPRYMTSVVFRNGEVSTIPMVARKALGVTDAEADCLFRGSNDIKDIETIIDGLLNGTLDPNSYENAADRDIGLFD